MEEDLQLQELVSPGLAMSFSEQSFNTDDADAPTMPEFMVLEGNASGRALVPSQSENLHHAAPYLNFVENVERNSSEVEIRGRPGRPSNNSRPTSINYRAHYSKRSNPGGNGSTASTAPLGNRARSQAPTSSANRRLRGVQQQPMDNSEPMPFVHAVRSEVFGPIGPSGIDENVNNIPPPRVNPLPPLELVHTDPEQDSDMGANFRREAYRRLRELTNADILVFGEEIEGPDGELIGPAIIVDIQRMDPEDDDDQDELNEQIP